LGRRERRRVEGRKGGEGRVGKAVGRRRLSGRKRDLRGGVEGDEGRRGGIRLGVKGR